jgi:hypothetical protein
MKAKIFILMLVVFPGFYTTFGQGMIIQPNACLTVTGGGKLFITDPTNGMLTIKSNSSGTGSLVVDANAGSSVSVAAHSNVELYLTGSNSTSETDLWHMVSSPISDAVSGAFLGDYLLSYDEPTNFFSYITETNVPLTPMRGFEAWAWVPVAKTDVFNGTLNNGSQSMALTRTNVPIPIYGFNGWNLLGNPYPSAIDFDAASGWTFGDAEQKVWIWNTGGTYKGQFATHIRGGVSVNGGSRYIPAEQGFFLHCTASTTVSMDNNVRVHSNQSYYKSVETEPTTNILRLVVSGNGYNHETVIDFNPDASTGYDDFDAWYYDGTATAPTIYTIVSNDLKLCINTLPQITNNLTIPVVFNTGLPGTFTISANDLNTFGGGVTITLLDQNTGASQNLMTNPEYSFSAAPEDNPYRFLVIFGILPFGTNDNAAPENVRIYSFGDAVFIKTSVTGNTNGQVYIYDPIGKDLFHGNLSGNELTKISSDLNTGYYVVKVVTGNSVYSKKVFISS